MSATSSLLRPAALRAKVQGPTAEQWTALVSALTIDVCKCPLFGQVRPFNHVTPFGGLGAFAMRPQRLAELGVVMPPKKFLASPLLQYNTLAKSLRRYDALLTGKRPGDMSRSGALALLHHFLGDLGKWEKARNRSTIELFERANGLF